MRTHQPARTEDGLSGHQIYFDHFRDTALCWWQYDMLTKDLNIAVKENAPECKKH